MNPNTECLEARKKSIYAILAAIIGHLLVIFALVFLFAIPMLDWTGYWIMTVIGMMLAIIGLIMIIKERKACLL